MLAAIVLAVDEQVAVMLAARDELARHVGMSRRQCAATVCSSRWNGSQDAAGTDTGGEKRQRSRKG